MTWQSGVNGSSFRFISVCLCQNSFELRMPEENMRQKLICVGMKCPVSIVEFSFPMAVFFYFYECDSLSHLMATVNLMLLKLFLFPGHSAGFSSNCWSVYFTKRNWGQWFEDCISESLGKHFQNIHSQFNSPSFNAAAPSPKESVTVSKNCI